MTDDMSDLLTSTDKLTAARERHVKSQYGDFCNVCGEWDAGDNYWDDAKWPCDAARFRALADELAMHLKRAIHDLIEDWEPGGPQMDYDAARDVLTRLEDSHA